ncbi:suppressor of fused domain protein [Actinophytocola gossypii]|uniref:suppressor of fused domain protein n=1 Tax=Actinophytocola gossypii TaxID=2812003 RepID=UPI0021A40D90|nr:suppressor of fused domain protein [Actinophytocola gossypii]
MSSRVERYLAHLDRLSGGIEPVFQPVPSEGDLPDVTVMIYRDLPEPGHVTGITYGLSLAEHPEWRHGRPELCLSVRSDDPAWAHAAGWVAGRLRGDCPFRYGDTIDFREQVSPESAMTSVFVFAPFVLDLKDYADIDVGPPGHEGHDVVHIAGLYPIHDVEREYIHEHGLEDFWHRDWDPADVTRPPCVP